MKDVRRNVLMCFFQGVHEECLSDFQYAGLGYVGLIWLIYRYIYILHCTTCCLNLCISISVKTYDIQDSQLHISKQKIHP